MNDSRSARARSGRGRAAPRRPCAAARRTAGSPRQVHVVQATASAHPSHAIYLTVVNTGDACVIEPAVPCDHCGYCKSHGH